MFNRLKMSFAANLRLPTPSYKMSGWQLGHGAAPAELIPAGELKWSNGQPPGMSRMMHEISNGYNPYNCIPQEMVEGQVTKSHFAGGNNMSVMNDYRLKREGTGAAARGVVPHPQDSRCSSAVSGSAVNELIEMSQRFVSGSNSMNGLTAEAQFEMQQQQRLQQQQQQQQQQQNLQNLRNRAAQECNMNSARLALSMPGITEREAAGMRGLVYGGQSGNAVLGGPSASGIGPVRSRSSVHLHHTVAPYPNVPQQYMMKKRAQLTTSQQTAGQSNSIPSDFQSTQFHSTQNGVRSTSSMLPLQSSQQATVPAGYRPSTRIYPDPMPGLPQYSSNDGLNQFHQTQPNGFTPCSQSQPPPTASSSVNNSGFAVNPLGSSANPANVRLSLPLRDGVVLPAFKLEHNRSTSNYTFILKDHIHQNLMARNDVDLELRCFTRDESIVDWPATMSVNINSIPTTLDRTNGHHRPLYLKSLCQLGLNSLQISVNQCCCTHLIILQIVHCPSLRSVLRGLLNKRLMVADQGIIKIKRYLMMIQQQTPSHSQGGAAVSVNLSLLCPLSRRRIALPARGHDCRHLQEKSLDFPSTRFLMKLFKTVNNVLIQEIRQNFNCIEPSKVLKNRRAKFVKKYAEAENVVCTCFDLETYLIFNSDRNLWRCPICKVLAILEYLEIDQYLWGIVRELAATTIDEVTIDITGSWKPVFVSSGNRNEQTAEMSSQRCTKLMTVSNITLPNVESWTSSHRNNSTAPSQTASSQDPRSPESVVLYSPLSCLSDPSLIPTPSPYQPPTPSSYQPKTPNPYQPLTPNPYQPPTPNSYRPPTPSSSCQPPSTPDCFVVPTTASTVNIQSPICNGSVASPTSRHPPPVSPQVSSLASSPFQPSGTTQSRPAASTLSSPSVPQLPHSTTSNPLPSNVGEQFSGASQPRNSVPSTSGTQSSSLVSMPRSSVLCFDSSSIFSEQQKKEVIDDILSETMPDLAEFLPADDNLNMSLNTALQDDDLLSFFN